MSCKVYIACKMTGRDKAEMVTRAKFVRDVFSFYGLEAISPVLEEGVQNEKGALTPNSTEELKGHWKRDKDIIAYRAHVVFCDEAERKSLGVEREYGFNRYALWKPTVTLLPTSGPNIAWFEDDYVADSLHEAAALIRHKWGTWPKRFIWRLNMLKKTLPKWLGRQLYGFR